MIVYAQYSVERILPYIGFKKKPFQIKTKLGTFKVKASSQRLECLKRNQNCVVCLRRGSIFRLERSRNPKEKHCKPSCLNKDCSDCAPLNKGIQIDKPHLNLYCRDPDGKWILMTQDHIIPKSKGGLDNQDNLQTMCVICNTKKGSNECIRY